MPDFLPEGTAPSPSDDERKSWLKISALASETYAGGNNAPGADDDIQTLAHKTAKSLYEYAG
jgi:hypothetical protein